MISAGVLINASLLRLVVSGVLLLGCAAFSFEYQSFLLVLLMLFYPVLDTTWTRPLLFTAEFRIVRFWLLLILISITCAIFDPSVVDIFLPTLLLAALPEEWFFRAYFQGQLIKLLGGLNGSNVKAAYGSIIITSLLFSVLHGVIQMHWLNALLVFIPSIFFGWIYYKTKDIVLLVLLHFSGNVFIYTAHSTGYM